LPQYIAILAGRSRITSADTKFAVSEFSSPLIYVLKGFVVNLPPEYWNVESPLPGRHEGFSML
jgi:hypothetical protein